MNLSFLNSGGELSDAVSSLGRASLNAIAPDQIDYYLCSLELIDSLGETKGFLAFPVMPKSITETNIQIGTITKTNSGISDLINTTFVPKDIVIQGTFGRKLRFLTGSKEPDNQSIPFFNGNLKLNNGYGGLMKTGYGILKILQKMITVSRELDSNKKPHILVFTNYAFNSSYIVDVLQDSYNQSEETNMMWNYAINMKAVAPAEFAKRNKKYDKELILLTNVSSGLIVKKINNLINSSIDLLWRR